MNASFILPNQVYTTAKSLKTTFFQIKLRDAYYNNYTSGGDTVRKKKFYFCATYAPQASVS